MNILTNTRYAAVPALYTMNDGIMAEPLADADSQEALEFLSSRPADTVILASWIRDHGMVSPQHRGAFYGCRDLAGDLIGVAMIGRNILFEARTDEAVAAFGKCAQDRSDIRMIFVENHQLPLFWDHFRGEVPMPNVSLYRQIVSGRAVAVDIEPVEGLRAATCDELDQIVSAHAEMVRAETGVDPMRADPEGFRMRCAKRIEDGKVWVWMKGRQFIFKTDILAVTPEATYLEGLWVDPEHRGNRYGSRCLANLGRHLLNGSNALCGFLSAETCRSHSLYLQAGFSLANEYARIYL